MNGRKRTLDAAAALVVAATLVRQCVSHAAAEECALGGNWEGRRPRGGGGRRERETSRVYSLLPYLTQQFVGKTIH